MVRRPAVYELNGETTLAQVLDLAGGPLIAAMALAGAGGTAARAAVVAPQVSASCDLQPNTYVAGTDKVGDRWGAAGYIRSYPVTVPAEDENFSDQALHVGLTAVSYTHLDVYKRQVRA